MVNDEIRVDARLDKESWDELTEYIDQHKDTRKHSKQFYLEKILEMALSNKENRTKEVRKAEESYKNLKDRIENEMGINK